MAEESRISRALILEADRDLAAAAEALLAAAGCTVRRAGSAGEAVRAAGEFSPELAILDLDLPGTAPAELVAGIRAAAPSCRLAAMTGGSEPAVLDRARALGIERFVLKSPGVLSFRATLLGCLGAGEPVPARNRRVLVVDDEESIRRILKRFLDGKGYEVETAENGAQALEAARYFKPAMILLDISMPGKDGIQTLRELSGAFPGIGVIMVTANADEERARECLRLGASDYISKPFDLETLETSLMVKLVLAP